MPQLSKAPAAELVKNLSHPNGWWRDTCQRLLVERAEPASVPLLNAVVDGKSPGATPLGKVHALWALQGMDKLDDDVAAAAAKDADPRVRRGGPAGGRDARPQAYRRRTCSTRSARSAQDPDPRCSCRCW